MRTRLLFRMAVPLTSALLAVVALWSALSPRAAYATTLCVNTTGAGGCFTSIQTAIDAATSGDGINIAAGTYTESVTLNKAVSLNGADRNSTIVRALPNQRALTVTGSIITPSTTIAGLTFSGGSLGGASCPASCGGAVLVTGGALPSFIFDILRNNAAFKGGGLYADSAGTLFVQYTDVLSNTTTNDGGGINATSGITLLLNGARVQNNRSTSNFGFGGGILADGRLVLEFTDIISNAVTGPGGGAYASGDVSTFRGSFQANTSGDQGGGLRVNANLSSQSTDFISNTAKQGGGVHVSGNVNVFSGTFRSNQASVDDGGGLYGKTTAFILNTTFVSNTAPLRGGGALFVGATQIFTTVFQSNTSQLLGGGLFVSSTVTLSNTSFLSNTENGASGFGGGGAYVNGNATVNGGRFQSNACLSACTGGGLRVDAGLTQINAAQFISNSAAFGGGLVVFGSTLLLTQTPFTGSSAPNGGGGLYTTAATNVSGGAFADNHASAGSGGGAYVSNNLTLSGTQVSGNSALQSGGGIYVASSATITGSAFANNSATNGGGLRAPGTLNVERSTFVDNSAVSGGGIYHPGDGTGFIVNSLFVRNHAANYGAALTLGAGQPVTILHTTIAGTLLNPRPAISLFTGTLTLRDTIIVSHSAGISLTGSNLSAINSLWFGNGVDLFPSGVNSIGLIDNVYTHPLFINTAVDNYHLSPLSPAIDAGVNAGVTTDFDGEPRPLGAGFDIGFDEVNVRKVLLPLVVR
jgi:fibronectin-binding autotransporter adhesin